MPRTLATDLPLGILAGRSRGGSAGGFAGAVLDAGCGTGENALHVAALGSSVLGVDVAETALATARKRR